MAQGLDAITYNAAVAYVKKTMAGAGAIKGDPGEDGVGIVDIAKTGTSGLVDTYTITLSNGNTKTFTVTNGQGIESMTQEEMLAILNGGGN